MKRLCAFVLLIAVSAAAAGAAGYRSAEFYYTVTFPAGWTLSDDEDSTQIIFSNKADDAAVVIGVFPAEPGLTDDALLRAVIDKMRLKGETETLTFKGFTAAAGNFHFTTNGTKLIADIIVFHTDTSFFMLMGSALRESWTRRNDEVRTLLASFTLDAQALDAAYRKDGTSATTKASVPADTTHITKQTADDKSALYAMKIKWKNLETVFTFVKPDYYTAVHEGQEIVASGNLWEHYGVDPEKDAHYTETFWGRFFQDMYDKNYRRVSGMVNWFRDQAKEKKWTSYELAVQVIECVQAIPYERPYQVITDQSQAAAVLDYFTPNEIAWYDKGDCDTKSMLIVMILRQLGFDLVMYFSEPYQHAMAGINLNARGTYKEYGGRKYYFVESTYPGWNIGDLPNEFGDPDKWSVVPIQ
jgi:hypothetical protein